MMKKFFRPSKFLLGLNALVIIALAISSCTGTNTPTANIPSATLKPTLEPTATKNTNSTATATPEVNQDDQPPDPLIENPEDLDGVKVRFLHAWPADTSRMLEEVALQFSLTNPWGIWVDVEAYGNEALLISTLQSDMESGNPPGLIAVHPTYLNNIDDIYSTIDLSSYYDDPDWGFSPDEQADLIPLYLEAFTNEDMLRALPISPSASVLFFNQTWAEELGFSDPPFMEANFREVNCAATQFNLQDESEENDGTGGWVMSFDPIVLLSWYSAFGGAWEQSQVPIFSDETGSDTFGSLKLLYDQGCIWIGRKSEPYQYFADRLALMYAGTLDQIELQTGWMAQAGNDDQWSVVGFPGPAGDTIHIDSPGLFITESSPEKQLAAWLFAKHLLSPEIQAELIESSFMLPVRQSTMELIGDFSESYPQWVQAVDLVENAAMVPTSEEWDLGQWVLQDAIYQIMIRDAEQLPTILEELDQMILELTGD